jgi:hypothetical protein
MMQVSPTKLKINTRKENYQSVLLKCFYEVPLLNNMNAPCPLDIMKEVIDYLYIPFEIYCYTLRQVFTCMIDHVISERDLEVVNTPMRLHTVPPDNMIRTDRYIYLIGRCDIRRPTKVERFDMISKIWTLVSSVPTELTCKKSIIMRTDNTKDNQQEQQHIYLFGRRKSMRYYCQIYNIETDQWSEGPRFSLSHKDNDVCFTNIGPVIYLFQSGCCYIRTLDTSRKELSFEKLELEMESDFLKMNVSSFELETEHSHNCLCFALDSDHIILINTRGDVDRTSNAYFVYQYTISTNIMIQLAWKLPWKYRVPLAAWYDRFTNSLYIRGISIPPCDEENPLAMYVGHPKLNRILTMKSEQSEQSDQCKQSNKLVEHHHDAKCLSLTTSVSADDSSKNHDYWTLLPGEVVNYLSLIFCSYVSEIII